MRCKMIAHPIRKAVCLVLSELTLLLEFHITVKPPGYEQHTAAWYRREKPTRDALGYRWSANGGWVAQPPTYTLFSQACERCSAEN